MVEYDVLSATIFLGYRILTLNKPATTGRIADQVEEKLDLTFDQ
jgi:hypothetical protein